MRVLFVSSGNSKEGISPIIKNQGASLKRKGIEIDFFTIKGKGIKGYLKNIPLIRNIGKEKYDIIHVHYSLSAFATTLSGISPLVVSLMGSDINSGRSFYRIIRIFNRIFWKRVIVKSKDMKNKLDLKNMEIIPNGVDLQKFKPVSVKKAVKYLGWDLHKKHILFAANPKRPEKNFRLAENSFERVNYRNIEFHFLDNISNEEMVNYYNASDVILLTSLWEGSPNVIKEAMACNIPIVSTDVGDVKDVIGSTNGCFITTFEPEDVAKKIQKALDFGKRTNGRENIEHLESSIIADKIIEVYKSVLNK